MEPILSLQNVKYNYPGELPILNNINFNLYHGDKIGILAPNGSGKTTLFQVIMGLIRPVFGKLEIFGEIRECERDFSEVRKRIGLLFQDPEDQLFCPTVLDDVAFGPLNLKKTRKEALNIARDTLKFLDIQDLGEKITYKLSGGEKRMVSLATVLSMEPEVLLLDEPTSALDFRAKNKLICILKKLDKTCIIASHELDFLSKTTKSIITIKDGSIFSDFNSYTHFHEHTHQMGKESHKHS